MKMNRLIMPILFLALPACTQNPQASKLTTQPSSSQKSEICHAPSPLIKEQVAKVVKHYANKVRIIGKNPHFAHEFNHDLIGYLDVFTKNYSNNVCRQSFLGEILSPVPEFKNICLSYVARPKRIAINRDDYDLNISANISSGDLIRHCVEYLDTMIGRLDSLCHRTRLSIDEAKHLAKRGKLAYHYTFPRNLASIMKNGLDPSYGGRIFGMCEKLAMSEQDKISYKKISKQFVHFTLDQMSAHWIFYNFQDKLIHPTLLAFRFDPTIQRYEKDPDMQGGFKTRLHIPPEDIVEIPFHEWENFGLGYTNLQSHLAAKVCLLPN